MSLPRSITGLDFSFCSGADLRYIEQFSEKTKAQRTCNEGGSCLHHRDIQMGGSLQSYEARLFNLAPQDPRRLKEFWADPENRRSIFVEIGDNLGLTEVALPFLSDLHQMLTNFPIFLIIFPYQLGMVDYAPGNRTTGRKTPFSPVSFCRAHVVSGISLAIITISWDREAYGSSSAEVGY